MHHKRKYLFAIGVSAVVFFVFALLFIRKVRSNDDHLITINEFRYDSIGGMINLTVNTKGKKQDYEPRIFLDNASCIVNLNSENKETGTKNYNMYFVDAKDSKDGILFLDEVKQNDILFHVTDKLSCYKNDKCEFYISAVAGYIKGILIDEEMEVTINYKDGSTYPVYSTATMYSNELPLIRFPNHKDLGASIFWLDDIQLDQIESVEVNGQTLMLSNN